ncbi:PQQ-like beta-propeller repeat protein [Micromonospora sp. NBC_01655]|uniref:outer membrane protein assembly factor BamB family protein n=1 Tax=Micromonospora sp. NBC_01655 TaxID=2975983 RepID=UPI002254FD71|nr:PQQ-binding-like beta-propeller repeat protein [Micromonospora sp. NBC_01655]MCX4473713.1 PQQ-like beta-propeller repeat protein [Micromonospora sp. NBC_01655]
MTVIDLGELRGAVEPEPPRPPRAVGRPLRVALAGAVALLTLAASAPVARPASAVVPGGPGVEVLLVGGGRLYVAVPETPGSGGTRGVTVYATPAGAGGVLRPLWRTSVPGGEGLFQVQEHGGFVLITGRRDDRVAETVALDAATGRQRWRQPGFPTPTVGGGLLLSGIVEGETTELLRVVDLPSGRLRWSVPVDRGRTAHHYQGAEIDRVVLIPESGRIEARDAGSGAVLRAGDPHPAGSPGYQSASLAGDLLLLTAHDGIGGSRRVTAYGLAVLDRRWELDLPPTQSLMECGDLLCVGSQEAGLLALDPATLRPRWVNPRWQWVAAVRGDRLLVAADGMRGATVEFAVLDAATGRTVAELGGWEMVPNQDPDGPLFGIRRTREGGLLVAELDPARAVARWLDVLPEIPGECHSAGRDLVCRRPGGTYGWWRLPR